MNATDPNIITDRAGLRQIYKQPADGAVRKVLKVLDRHCREFIERSPFCVVATSGTQGNLDASPKGGPPGFVVVIDNGTVALPDWPGNNRLDGLENVLDNSHVGLLFFLPGMNEMVRLNGRAEISIDPVLRARFLTEGHEPRSVMIIRIDQVYLHCARAIQRSGLWDPARHIDRKAAFPTLGKMLAEQITGYDAESSDRRFAENLKNLYKPLL